MKQARRIKNEGFSVFIVDFLVKFCYRGGSSFAAWYCVEFVKRLSFRAVLCSCLVKWFCEVGCRVHRPTSNVCAIRVLREDMGSRSVVLSHRWAKTTNIGYQLVLERRPEECRRGFVRNPVFQGVLLVFGVEFISQQGMARSAVGPSFQGDDRICHHDCVWVLVDVVVPILVRCVDVFVLECSCGG